MSDAAIAVIASSVAGLLGAALTALGVYLNFKMKMMEMQTRLADEKSQKESYKSIAKDSMTIVETITNEKLTNEGKPPLVALANVVPEHKSPVTAEAQAAADLQTQRAKLVAATLILGLPPRESGEPETAAERVTRQAAEGRGSADTPVAMENKLTATIVASLKEDIAEVPKKVVDEIEKGK